MIELCNELNANCGQHAHMADDDFVRQEAMLVRNTLKPA